MRNNCYGRYFYDLVATDNLNIPEWAETPRDFFAAADRYERTNGAASKQITISLPCELSLDDNIKIAQNIADKILGNNRVGCWAIHSKPAVTQAVTNIHMHLMFSDRIVTDTFRTKAPLLFFKRYNRKHPELGGYRKDDRFASFGKKAKENINWMRQEIEDAINEGYQKAGMNIKVSCKSLQEQYNDAVNNSDKEMAEKLNRTPTQYIGIASWKKMLKILEENNAINLSQPIPLMPTKETYKIHRQLLQENPRAYFKLFNRLESLNTKLQLNYQDFLIEQEKLLSNIELQASEISANEYINLLNSQILKLKRQIHHNNQYQILYNNIYKNATTISTVINNVITRGKLRRYYKAQQTIKQAEQEMQTLKTANKVTLDIQKKYDWIITINTEQSKKLEHEIQQINREPNTSIRFNKLTARLKKSFTKAKKRYQSNLTMNQEYQNIINQINTTIISIPSNISLPLNQTAIQIYKSDKIKDIKKIPTILKSLNKYIETKKPKKIQEKEHQKNKDNYSR